MVRPRPVICALLLLCCLVGCGPRASDLAEDGRQRLIGLRADDLRLCAGVPNLTAASDGGDFWTYDRTPTPSGVSAPVPMIGGSLSVTAGSSCRVTFHLVEAKVTRIGYSAESDVPLSRNAACAPVVQGCLRMLDLGTVRPE